MEENIRILVWVKKPLLAEGKNPTSNYLFLRVEILNKKTNECKIKINFLFI